MFKYASGIVLVSIIFVAEPTVLRAEEGSDIHPYLTSEFFIDMGVYFPDRKVGIQVDGTLVGINDPIDFNEEFGLDVSMETSALAVVEIRKPGNPHWVRCPCPIWESGTCIPFPRNGR